MDGYMNNNFEKEEDKMICSQNTLISPTTETEFNLLHNHDVVYNTSRDRQKTTHGLMSYFTDEYPTEKKISYSLSDNRSLPEFTSLKSIDVYGEPNEEEVDFILDLNRNVLELREELGNYILKKGMTSYKHKLVHLILRKDWELGERYKVIDLSKICRENKNNLEKLPASLFVLETYATNVIRMQGQGSHPKTIDALSKNYKSDLEYMVGAVDILSKMGYTDLGYSSSGKLLCFSFTQKNSPSYALLSKLVVDLMIAKWEVKKTVKQAKQFKEQNFESSFSSLEVKNLSISIGGSCSDLTNIVNITENTETVQHIEPNIQQFGEKTSHHDLSNIEVRNMVSTGGLCSDLTNIVNIRGNTETVQHIEPNIQQFGEKTPHDLSNVEVRNMVSTGGSCSDLTNIVSIKGNTETVQHIEPNIQQFGEKTSHHDLSNVEVRNMVSTGGSCSDLTNIANIKENTTAIKRLQKFSPEHASHHNGYHITKTTNKEQNEKLSVPVKVFHYLSGLFQSATKHQEKAYMQSYAPDVNIDVDNVEVTSPPTNDSWNCIKCTYQNNANSMKCEMCLTLKNQLEQNKDLSMKNVYVKKVENTTNQQAKFDKRCAERRRAIILSQNKMKKNAEEIVSLLRTAEQNGCTIEQCGIALANSHKDWVSIQNWIKKHLNQDVCDFQHFATNCLEKKENVVGAGEAEHFLFLCSGDIEQAVNAFVLKRKQQVNNLQTDFPSLSMDQIYQSLFIANGDEYVAELDLKNHLFEDFEKRMWLSFPTFCYVNRISDPIVPDEVKHRIIMCENDLSYLCAVNCLRLSELGKHDFSDCIVAAKNSCTFEECLQYMNHPCCSCYGEYPRNKLLTNFHCQCEFCFECYLSYLTVTISEKHIRHLVCPFCELPNLEGDCENYFANLDNQIRFLVANKLLEQQIYHTFYTKVFEFHMMKNKNFRWCAHCSNNGFIYEPRDDKDIKMECNKCRQSTCYLCKEKWMVQHEGIACEKFKQWKVSNDPELQWAGVAALLSRNGLECPACQFRYDLARGGCMHFTCSQCGFQFCSGCSAAYRKGAQCGVHSSCPNLGIHAHHPRDCLMYLRDWEAPRLIELRKLENVKFQLDVVEEGAPECQVMEQKEKGGGLVDEACGEGLFNGHMLCEKHTKEYLVLEINKHSLDPANLMNVAELWTVLQREKKMIPQKTEKENEAEYLKRLKEHTMKESPLKARQKSTL